MLWHINSKQVYTFFFFFTFILYNRLKLPDHEIIHHWFIVIFLVLLAFSGKAYITLRIKIADGMQSIICLRCMCENYLTEIKWGAWFRFQRTIMRSRPYRSQKEANSSSQEIPSQCVLMFSKLSMKLRTSERLSVLHYNTLTITTLLIQTNTIESVQK